jgi:hypothetical protein
LLDHLKVEGVRYEEHLRIELVMDLSLRPWLSLGRRKLRTRIHEITATVAEHYEEYED